MLIRRSLFAGFAFLTLIATPSFAQQSQAPGQQPDTAARNRENPVRLTPVAVTATRSEKDVFLTPSAVGIMDATDLLELKPNTAADLFSRMPGLDVSGVGANQVRPSIRGQRGQRVLLIQDGLRLNNARRQQDFGEIPALVDVGKIETIEVVRGPSSVLYGTDAIGSTARSASATANTIPSPRAWPRSTAGSATSRSS
jgi:hemoglobin/transferrin/lactoferrin receptor protein